MTFKLHTSITKNCTFHSNRLLGSRTTLVHPIEPSTIATQLCSHHSIRSFGTKRARTDNIKTLISSSLMALSENLYPFPSSVASITRNRSPSIGGLLRFVISFDKVGGPVWGESGTDLRLYSSALPLCPPASPVAHQWPGFVGNHLIYCVCFWWHHQHIQRN